MTLVDSALAIRRQINALTVQAAGAGTFTAQIQAYIAEAKQLAADGLTMAEFWHLLTGLVTVAVAAASELANPGQDKKQWVLQAVGLLYDTIAPALFTGWLLPVSFVLLPLFRRIVLAAADGMIEAVYAALKKNGS